jgi:hypothetical protein
MCVTYQIIMSTRWNLNTKFPYPFNQMFPFFSLFSFDFLDFECLTNENKYMFTIYASSFFPIFISLASLVVYAVRVYFLKQYHMRLGIDPSDEENSSPSQPINSGSASASPSSLSPPWLQSANNTSSQRFEQSQQNEGENQEAYIRFHREKRIVLDQHIYFILFLSYLVLPGTSLKHLQSFDCVELSKSGLYFLRVDTQIDCNSVEYINFRTNVMLLLGLYQMIPVVWMIVLYRQREELYPAHGFHSFEEEEEFYLARASNPNLSPLKFLFNSYKCSKWWFEVPEMYRRIVFIGILPLVSSVSATRASFGCLLAIISAVMFREEQPYWLKSTNLVAYVAQVWWMRVGCFRTVLCSVCQHLN